MYLESDEEYRKVYNNFRKGCPYNVTYISDSFIDMYINRNHFKSKEEYDSPTYELLDCPICFKNIWNSAIECTNCHNYMCEICIDRMLDDSFRYNENLNCPFCRYLLNSPEPIPSRTIIYDQLIVEDNDHMLCDIILFIGFLSTIFVIVYVSISENI